MDRTRIGCNEGFIPPLLSKRIQRIMVNVILDTKPPKTSTHLSVHVSVQLKTRAVSIHCSDAVENSLLTEVSQAVRK